MRISRISSNQNFGCKMTPRFVNFVMDTNNTLSEANKELTNLKNQYNDKVVLNPEYYAPGGRICVSLSLPEYRVKTERASLVNGKVENLKEAMDWCVNAALKNSIIHGTLPERSKDMVKDFPEYEEIINEVANSKVFQDANNENKINLEKEAERQRSRKQKNVSIWKKIFG